MENEQQNAVPEYSWPKNVPGRHVETCCMPDKYFMNFMSAILLCAGVVMTLVTAVLFGMAINEFMSASSGQTGTISIVYALATVAAFMCSMTLYFFYAVIRCEYARIKETSKMSDTLEKLFTRLKKDS